MVELHTSTIALYESETPRVVVDKYNGDNFSLFKFKMEMILDEKDLWDIVEGTKRALSIGVIRGLLQPSRSKSG